MVSQSNLDIVNSVKKFVYLLLLFIFGQIIVLILFGLSEPVIIRGDSIIYFRSSREFPELSSNQKMYIGYIALLHLSQFINSSGLFMVIMQSIAVLTSAYALFSITKEFGTRRAAWIATSFYLLNPMLAQWTRYILTESFFYSSVIIALRLSTIRKKWSVGLVFLVALFLILLRPNGIIPACSAIVVSIFVHFRGTAFRLVLSLVSVALCIFFLSSSLKSEGYGDESVAVSIFETTLEGVVIYGAPELNMRMPKPRNEERSTVAFVKYFSENSVANLKLGVARVSWELKQIRPWYSKNLNVFLVALMSWFYVSCIVSMVFVRTKILTWTILVFTIPSTAAIALTWAIWEGRFGWGFLALWIPHVGIGTTRVIELFFQASNAGGNSARNSKIDFRRS